MERCPLGLTVVDEPSPIAWEAFLRSLAAQGPHGVRLAVSQADGLAEAFGAVLPGVPLEANDGPRLSSARSAGRGSSASSSVRTGTPWHWPHSCSARSRPERATSEWPPAPRPMSGKAMERLPPLPGCHRAPAEPPLPHLPDRSSVLLAVQDAVNGVPEAVPWLRHQLVLHEAWCATHRMYGGVRRAEELDDLIARIHLGIDLSPGA